MLYVKFYVIRQNTTKRSKLRLALQQQVARIGRSDIADVKPAAK
jgi:hypothetical protein